MRRTEVMVANTIQIPPPGHFIREELEARGWTQAELAYMLDVPVQAVNMITSGKRGITAEMAKKMAAAFDVAPEFFLNLQKTWELAHAPEPDPSVAKKARLQSLYPVREMIISASLARAVAHVVRLAAGAGACPVRPPPG